MSVRKIKLKISIHNRKKKRIVFRFTANDKASAAFSTSAISSSMWVLFTRPFHRHSISSKKSLGIPLKELIFWSLSPSREIISPILTEAHSHSFTWRQQIQLKLHALQCKMSKFSINIIVKHIDYTIFKSFSWYNHHQNK